MMPVQEIANQSTSQNPTQPPLQPVAMATGQGESINYKKKYKVLKRKMRMLVYEQECFMEELKKAQRKLLKVSRDRSFLLDRLLQYEKLDDTSDDTDATASSDSDADGMKEHSIAKPKKRKMQNAMNLANTSISLLPGNLNKQQASWLLQMTGAGDKNAKGETGTKRKGGKMGKKSGKAGAASLTAGDHGSSATGQMTREELERHLELKQSAKPQFMSLEKTPYSLPDDIFSHDNSNQDGDLDIKLEDPSSLLIHMPR